MEIFTNPADLDITIGQAREGDKFAIGIFRGPGHRGKPLLTSQPFAVTAEEAVESIRELLEGIRQVMTKEFEDDASVFSRYLNPDHRTVDESKVLSAELIARIVEKLKQDRSASTYAMLAQTG
ncbi:MAG: hypothetical protein AAB365_03545 [Patescibacteria group bacterium]